MEEEIGEHETNVETLNCLKADLKYVRIRMLQNIHIFTTTVCFFCDLKQLNIKYSNNFLFVFLYVVIVFVFELANYDDDSDDDD